MRVEVIVRFVDSRWIIELYCLNFLYIIIVKYGILWDSNMDGQTDINGNSKITREKTVILSLRKRMAYRQPIMNTLLVKLSQTVFLLYL